MSDDSIVFRYFIDDVLCILNNTVVEPKSRMRRLIWVQKSNESLRLENNLLIGAPPQVASESQIVRSGNVVVDEWTETKVAVGQNFLTPSAVTQAYVKGTRNKGPDHANDSGWRVGQILKAMDNVLEQQKPEAAIIMVGTNDISGGRVPEGYRAGLEEVVRKCVAAHCVPILNTIPPRRGHDEAVDDANKIIRQIARERQIPLADFHAECLRVRPGNSWDGTVISHDGVHPSGGESNNYGDDNLRHCGYALRNWVNFLVYRQLYFHVFAAESRLD